MTAQEAIKIMGTTRRINLQSLSVDVVVLDIKTSYGRTRYLVSPVAGTGQMWTEQAGLPIK